VSLQGRNAATPAPWRSRNLQASSGNQPAHWSQRGCAGLRCGAGAV